MTERRYIPGVSALVHVEKRADGKPMIAGYAAVFYNGTRGTEYELWPGVVERVMPGAFDRALREQQDVRALFNHDSSLVLGRTTARDKTLRLSVDSIGLRYEVDPPETQLGRDLPVLIDRGDITGSSFSFYTMGEDWRKEKGVSIRELKDLDLFDVSPVTFPAYEATTVGVRGAGDLADVRTSLEEWEQKEASRMVTEVVAKNRARALKIITGLAEIENP